jgi:nonribosomal peptide synthetase protein BlmV
MRCAAAHRGYLNRIACSKLGAVTGWDELSPQRQELLDLWLADSGIDDVLSVDDVPYAPPITQEQRTLAGIWQDVLEHDLVGIDDDYFARGGDSITAIVLVAKAQRAGLGFTTDDLFALRTIRRLAECTRPVVATSEAPSQPRRARLTPLQQGILFHALQDPTAYVAQVSCRLDGDVDCDELVAALQSMLDRHPVLRLAIDTSGAEPAQVVQPSVVLPVDVRDLRGEPSTALADYLQRDRARGFDLARAPLLRVALLRTGQRSVHVVLTHHHLLLDGWSQQLLVRDLLSAYDGLDGPAVDRDGFFRYLDWLCSVDVDLEHWRERLDGFSPSLVGRGGVTHGDSPTVGATLPAAESSAVASFARRNGLTVSTVLYGGWALLLGRLTGSADVGFGVTVSGRPAELPGATDALGMFINTLPLRVPLPADEPLVAWLAEVQRRRQELDRHAHTPLSAIARLVDGQLFDSIAVVENFPLLVAPGTSRRVTLSEVHAEIQEGYPLVFEAAPREEIALRLRHDPAVLDATQAQALLAALLAYLRAVAEPGQPPKLSEVATRLDEAAAAHRRAADRRRHEATATRLLTTRRQPAHPSPPASPPSAGVPSASPPSAGTPSASPPSAGVPSAGPAPEGEGDG